MTDPTPLTNATHDPTLRSWVDSANDGSTDFPIQNLPYGRFRRAGSREPWRIGVAIGDQVLDLKAAYEHAHWDDELLPLLEPLAAGDLNAFMDLGAASWHAVRAALSAALAVGSSHQAVLSVDGQAPIIVEEGDEIRVEASPTSLHFVRFQDPGYFYRNLTRYMEQNPWINPEA